MKSNMASPDSSLQTSCGDHPASYPMGSEDSSPGQQSNDDVKLTFLFWHYACMELWLQAPYVFILWYLITCWAKFNFLKLISIVQCCFWCWMNEWMNEWMNGIWVQAPPGPMDLGAFDVTQPENGTSWLRHNFVHHHSCFYPHKWLSQSNMKYMSP